jgi:hypothetical protein
MGWMEGWLAGWMDDGMNGNAVRVVWPWPSTMDDAETLSVREPGNGSIAVTSLMNFGKLRTLYVCPARTYGQYYTTLSEVH